MNLSIMMASHCRGNTMKTSPVKNSHANKKVVIYLLIGLLGYIVFAGSVMLFYQDDPTGMELADRQEFNRKYLATLSLTKPTVKAAVIAYLGSPDITEAKKVDEAIVQVLFYRTRQIKGDGITTKDECTPLLFLDGLLIAMGDDAWQQYKSY